MLILVFCYAFMDVNRSCHETGFEIWYAESSLVFICLLCCGLWSFSGVQGLGVAEAMLVSMALVVAQVMQGCRFSGPHYMFLGMSQIVDWVAAVWKNEWMHTQHMSLNSGLIACRDACCFQCCRARCHWMRWLMVWMILLALATSNWVPCRDICLCVAAIWNNVWMHMHHMSLNFGLIACRVLVASIVVAPYVIEALARSPARAFDVSFGRPMHSYGCQTRWFRHPW